MGTTMILAAALLIVFSKGSGGITTKGGVAGLVLTYTQQVRGARRGDMPLLVFFRDDIFVVCCCL